MPVYKLSEMMTDKEHAQLKKSLKALNAIELASWSAICAKNVLHNYENFDKKDTTPREAILAVTFYIQRKIDRTMVKKASSDAYLIARQTKDRAASAAARAAGYAASTVTEPLNAIVCATYAQLSVASQKGLSVAKEEYEWQLNQVQELLKIRAKKAQAKKERKLKEN